MVLPVDYGAAMFELVGDDLHAVGPVPVDLDGRDPEETIPDEHGRPFPLLALRGKVPCSSFISPPRWSAYWSTGGPRTTPETCVEVWSAARCPTRSRSPTNGEVHASRRLEATAPNQFP